MRTPFVSLPTEFPGIVSLFAAFPHAAPALNQVAQVLLCEDSPLTRGDRELIAAYVSRKNGCEFCSKSHAAFAAAQLDGGEPLVEAVLADADRASIPPKIRRCSRSRRKSGRAD